MSTAGTAGSAAGARASAAAVLTDGLYAGVIGAALVALWFLVLDTIAGHPLATPNMLGAWVIRGRQLMPGAPIDPALVTAYTAIHVIVFVILGTVASYLVTLLKRYPVAVVGLVFLFVFVEVGFFVFDAALGGGLMGRLGPWAVGIGNLVAAAGMAVYFRLRHPDLLARIERIWEE